MPRSVYNDPVEFMRQIRTLDMKHVLKFHSDAFLDRWHLTLLVPDISFVQEISLLSLSDQQEVRDAEVRYIQYLANVNSSKPLSPWTIGITSPSTGYSGVSGSAGNTGWAGAILSDPAEYGVAKPTPSKENKSHYCDDNWVKYMGLNEQFEFCKICDKKKVITNK